MLSKLIIDVPVPQDGATPLLERDDEDTAKRLVHYIAWISGLDDVRKQAVANFLCSNHAGLFRLQVINEESFTAPPAAFEQPSAFYLQSPPSDDHGISNTPQINHSMPAFNPTSYNTTVNCDERSSHDASQEQSYNEFFDEMLSVPDEDLHSLEKTKKGTNSRYHTGLEIMQNYESPNDAPTDLMKMSLAVRASYAIIRLDLKEFTKKILSRWLQNGLWPALNHTQAQHNDIRVQCSQDMMYLGVERDPESKTMLRRIARVRLYYWYEQEKMRRSQEPTELDRGIDIRTKSIDAFLEYFFADWECTDEERKRYFRSRFHIDKSMGKRWCELVQYLGEGILVICGKDLDTQMNSNNFPTSNVHALATFVTNCYPEAVQVSQSFSPVVKKFIQKGTFEEQEFTLWVGQLNWDFMENALEKVKRPPSQQGSWTMLPDFSNADLTGFVRRALIQS